MNTHKKDGNTIQKPHDVRNLNDVIKLWQKLHPTPNQQYVLQMLTELSQPTLESLPTFKVNCSSLPTAAHLVHDIFDDPEIHYRSCLTGKEEADTRTFLAGWNALEQNPGADINNRIQVPYSAWGVKASPNGLLSC